MALYHSPPVQTPHLSAAVKHLRGWVTLLACIVALCCGAQMLLYGFVNYTEVRFTEAAKTNPYGERSLKVVEEPGTVAPSVASSEGAGKADEKPTAGGVRSAAIAGGKETAPTRLKSNADKMMATVSDWTTAMGAVACVALAILACLGVAVAGGGNIPGVEKVVTACTWSVILGLLCLPWQAVFPSLKVPGIFAPYNALTAVADKLPMAMSSTAAFAQWLFMPLAAGVVSFVVLGLFRAGVERGVIPTSVNHFDAAIQKEMSDIAKRGVSASGPRTLGTIASPGRGAPANSESPLGDVGLVGRVMERAAEPTSVEAAVEQAAAAATSLVREAGGGRSVADRNFKRLI